ncbi:DUF3617 domain-containing protein [Geoalkalibacter sp.]|uniref:DUF3617 domain-containing protein n=1 Tax=Geoalkalibacter sp. TaxID=3041440 RepID=UPI00272EA6CF|nr:DUF3617 domain-containing protein [Geoalkalibacter sp.]
MKSKKVFFLAVAGFFSAGQVWAEPLRIEPGLWEQTVSVQSQSGKVENTLNLLQQQLEWLSPEQRRMMEDTLANHGVSLGDQTNTYRLCIGEDQADLDQVQLADENCTQEVVARTERGLKVRFNCTGTPPASGEGEITIVNPREYRGRAVIETQLAGRTEQLRIEQAGRWLSSDCGNLKPAMR